MKRQAPQKLFPMFFKLDNRRCLVVGAGSIAESKIASLVDTRAEVRVVSPEATPKVRSWARAQKITWERRAFRIQDLDGVFLVIAATSSPELHEEIFRESHRLGVLCNIVDVPHLCDFYYPAVVRRGVLQIAVSTSGQSPALAQRLRKELELQFAPQYEQWLASLGKTRDEIHANKTLTPEQRKQMLHELVSREAFDKFRKQSKRPSRGTGKR